MNCLSLSLIAVALYTQTMVGIAQTTTAPVHADADSTTALILDASKKKPTEYWQKAVARFKSIETTAPRHGIVLLGDSITSRWPKGMFPGDKVVNRGIGSDHIGGWKFFGLLDRMNTSVKVLEPEQVYLLIGVNDMLKDGPPMENMIASYDYLLDRLKEAAPGAKIIVHSILPVSKSEFVYMKKPILELNKHIEKMAEQKGLRYVDLYSRFADENDDLKAELTTDGVHLTKEGYRLWLDVLTDEGILKADDSDTTRSVQTR